MAGFCLPKEFATKFIDALKSGKIDPEKLIDMSSAERRAFLEPIVGEDSVHEVNALLESKLLLKDIKRGLVSWAKQVSGIKEPVRADLLSKIERLDSVLDAKDQESFLEDLAAKRLGTEITQEEAKNVVDATKDVRTARNQVPESDPVGSPARVRYGLKYVEFQKYISQLKSRATDLTWKEWLTSPGAMFDSLASTTKSVLSSLDNSFFGRQGIKTLYTHPGTWTTNFIKSWGDIGRELGRTKNSPDPMDLIKADVYSRPNALNGKYDAGGYDIGIGSEEAFPSQFPEKIPLLGRGFKAAETAFNGAAMRMRADLADKLIPRAEAFGVDTLNKEEASRIGRLVNSLTGRGDIGRLNAIGKEINSAVFSIKFLKANIDSLFQGIKAPIEMGTDAIRNKTGISPIERTAGERFARREAAVNLLKIVGTTAGILFLANTLFPGSVDFDPRSSNFGKIRIGKHTIDISGGQGSIITLAARLVPTLHDGKWGFYSKSGTSGKWTDLTAGKYGQQNGVDVLNSFWEGKLSPIAGVARDVWTGSTYDNTKPTATNEAEGVLTPLPIQDWEQLQEPNKGLAAGLMMLDALGLSVNTTPKKK